MKLKDIFKDHETKVFLVTDQDDENELNWLVEPTELDLIPEEEGFYFVKAREVSETQVVECSIGISTPERIVDFVVKQLGGSTVVVENYYEQTNSVIAAVAAECYGNYELYFAKENPQVGIDVLKEGLTLATNKSTVAKDLGYVLRDAGRVEEAIEAFLSSEEFGPSSYFTFWELSGLYAAAGQKEKEREYKEKYLAAGGKE
jgi:tetratricopeptide (TPR) repeat protein